MHKVVLKTPNPYRNPKKAPSVDKLFQQFTREIIPIT